MLRSNSFFPARWALIFGLGAIVLGACAEAERREPTGAAASGGGAGEGGRAVGGEAGEAGGAPGLGGARALLEEWEIDLDVPYVEPEGVFELVDSRGDAPGFPRPIELRLIDGEVSFSGGCNEHSGEYSFEGRTLRTESKWEATQAACDQPREHVDSFLTDFFGDAPRVSWDGELLVFATGEAALLFELTEGAHPDWPLFGTTWIITEWTYTTERPSGSQELHGEFRLTKDGRLDAWEGCVYIDGTYEETPLGFLILSVELNAEECEEYDPSESQDLLEEFFAPGEVKAQIIDRQLSLTRDGRELSCQPPR